MSMNTDRQPRASAIPSLFTVVVVVACLYFGREFLLPTALAALLSFLLAPFMNVLERWGLSRIPAVLVVAAVAFLLMGILIYVVAQQLIELATDLPKYRENLLGKVASLREQTGGPIGRAMATIQEIISAMNPAGSKPAALPVAVVETAQSSGSMIVNVLQPLLAPLGNAAIVILMVIFMLISQEDLRDRLIHLVSHGHLRLTTEALEEASTRVSRYLQAQILVNVLYGVPVGIGLYIIGVPNAALWGVLTIILRFLPYIGPWIAAAFPLLLSFAISQSWTQPLYTIGLFVVMELISNNVVEPWLYGASTGLSPLAIIVSALFWTWLWGAAGLVLATPLTVCVAVAGKHVHGLAFLDVLLGDKPPIPRSERLYQRVLALDEEETLDFSKAAIKEHGLPQTIDQVLLPAVRTLTTDFLAGRVPDDLHVAGLGLLHSVVDDLATTPMPEGEASVLCLPALNEADEIAALLLAEALRQRGVPATVTSSKLLVSETVEQALASQAPVICIVSVPPTSAAVAMNLCHRLSEKQSTSRLTVLIADPDQADFARRRERLKRSGAYDAFATAESALTTLSHLSGCEIKEEAV